MRVLGQAEVYRERGEMGVGLTSRTPAEEPEQQRPLAASREVPVQRASVVEIPVLVLLTFLLVPDTPSVPG